MKSLIKKITFLALTALISFSASAQVELKINPVGAIFNSPDLSVEYILKDHFGFEGRVGYSWSSIRSGEDLLYKGKGLVFIGGGRYYFNPKAGGDRLYIGAYTKYKNASYKTVVTEGTTTIDRQRLAVGTIFGHKILSKNERIALDLNFGIGRALMTNNSNNAPDDFENNIAITKLDMISTLAIAYRF